MRTALLALALAAAAGLVAFVYQQAVVEGMYGPAAMVVTAVLGAMVLGLLVLARLSGTRHRELVGKLLTAGVATVVSYLAIDVLAGWLLIVPLSPPLVPDAHRHHVLVPDSHAELRQRDFAYIQRVNHLGLRGREITVEKPAGTRRVLMLGDSFTMGKGVEDDQTFPALVEKSLGAALAACGGGAVEVLNGGVDSYSPLLSYLQLERDLSRLSPDLVVLNLDNSDLIQEAAYRQQALRDERGEIVAVPQVWQDSAYERLLAWTSRHLFLTRVLMVQVNRAMDHRDLTVRRVVNEADREHIAHTLEGDVDRSAQWKDIFASIGRIQRLTGALGADFVLATYPWGHQLSRNEWIPGRYQFMEEGERTSDLTARTIRKRATALDIPLFEAFPVFEAYQGDDKLYFDHDPHWTPAGHRVMADGLGGYIAEHHLPRWCAAP